MYHLTVRFLLLLLLPFVVHAFDGRVVGISDGDTLTVIDARHQQHKIRLMGIDAPEKAQPFGQKSKSNLSALAFNREVEIVGNKKDRYGRLIAKVMVAAPNCNHPTCPKTHDAGLMQITSGMAWWYRKYAMEQTPKDRGEYEIAELNAKTNRVALWSDKNPQPPWEFRRK